MVLMIKNCMRFEFAPRIVIGGPDAINISCDHYYVLEKNNIRCQSFEFVEYRSQAMCDVVIRWTVTVIGQVQFQRYKKVHISITTTNKTNMAKVLRMINS